MEEKEKPAELEYAGSSNEINTSTINYNLNTASSTVPIKNDSIDYVIQDCIVKDKIKEEIAKAKKEGYKKISLTVVFSETPITKKYELNEKKILIKCNAKPLSKGISIRIEISSLIDFAIIRNNLNYCSATMYGVVKGAKPNIQKLMVSKKYLDKNPNMDAVARTNDTMHYDPEGMVILFIDFDSDKNSGLSVEEKKEQFLNIFPQIANASHVESPSSSSNLYNSEDKSIVYRGLTGLHYYVLVKPDELEKIVEILRVRLICSHKVWTVVSNSGAVLPRTLIDLSVLNQPCRLDYPSIALAIPPIAQEINEAVYVEGQYEVVTLDMFTPLSDIEKKEADSILARLKKEIESTPEVKQIKANFERNITASSDEALERKYEIDYSAILKNHILPLNFPLTLPSGETQTVSYILDNKEKYDKCRVRDLFETSYSDERCCQLNLKGGRPNLYNYHTSETFYLTDNNVLFGKVRMPEGYYVNEKDEIWLQKEFGTEDRPKVKECFISHSAVAVTAIIDNMSDGSQKVQLTFIDGKQQKKKLVGRDIIAGRAITNLALYGLPVDSNNQRAMNAYLTAMINANPDLPRYVGISQLGFAKINDSENVFLTGEGCITKDGLVSYGSDELPVLLAFNDEETEKFAKNVCCKGDRNIWIDAARTLNQYPYVKLVVAAAAISPFIGKLGISNFVVNLGYYTSTGKTTTQYIAASISGNPQKIVPTFNNTRVGIERFPAILKNIATIFDDTKTIEARSLEDLKKILRNIIYRHSEGKGKVRSNVTLGLQKISTWESVMITSSEGSIVDIIPDGGAIARILDLKAMPFNAQDDETRRLVNNYEMTFKNNYGFALVDIVRLFMSNEETYRNQLQDHKSRLDSKLCGGVGDRLGKYVAAILTGINILNDAMGLGWSIDDVENLLLETCINQSTALSEGQKALSFMVEYAETHKFEELLYRGTDRENGEYFKVKYEPGQDTDRTPCVWSISYKGAYAGFISLKEERFAIGYPKNSLVTILTEAGFNSGAVISEWEKKGVLKKVTRSTSTKEGKVLYDNPQFVYKNNRIRHLVFTHEAIIDAKGGLGCHEEDYDYKPIPDNLIPF